MLPKTLKSIITYYTTKVCNFILGETGSEILSDISTFLIEDDEIIQDITIDIENNIIDDDEPAPMYRDLSDRTRQFINEFLYENSDNNTRLALIHNANIQFNANIEPTLNITPRLDIENNIFPFEVVSQRRVGGIEITGYEVDVHNQSPTRGDFFQTLYQVANNPDIVNLTVAYDGDNGVQQKYSFSRRDIRDESDQGQNNGVLRCISLLEGGHSTWGERLYRGDGQENYNIDFNIRTMTLNLSKFWTITRVMVGGDSRQELSLTNFTTIDIKSENNNCLLECFRHYKRLNFSNKDIRKFMGKRPDEMFSVKDIRNLEKLFGFNVSVFMDSATRDPNNSTNISVKRVYGSGSRQIIYQNKHFDVIKDIVDNPTLEEDDIKEDSDYIHKHFEQTTDFMFYDLETTYNPETSILEPYSWSVIRCNQNGVIKDQYTTIDMRENIVSRIIKMSRKTRKTCLIGFNNSKFDNFFLMEQIVKSNLDPYDVVIAGNSILSFRFLNFTVRDLCRMLNTSLDKACKAFVCEFPKLSFNHDYIQNYRFKGQLSEFINDNLDEIITYVNRDCIALSEVFFKSRKAVKTLTNSNIEDYPTVASLSYASFLRTLDKEFELPIEKDNNIDNFIRKSIIGGRAQVFQGSYKDFSAVDVVSLYPYVMLANRFPVGKATKTERYQDGKIGVYKVTVGKQADRKHIIPFRSETLDWNHNLEEINCILNSVDIECLKRHSVKVTVGEGYYWENDQDGVFDKYFYNLKEEKKRQDKLKEGNSDKYNPVLREFCKLMMNSLSGKVAQRKRKNVSKIITSEYDLTKFEKLVDNDSIRYHVGNSYVIGEGEKIKVRPTGPVIYGSLIYSYARSHMYDSVISKVPVYGMDTDSAFIKSCDLDVINNLIGEEFGEFTIESKNHDAILVAPKCYVFHNDDDIIKTRFKGVNLKKDKVVPKDMLHELEKYTLNQKVDYFLNDKNHVGLDVYRGMLKNEVYVLSSSINKRICTDQKEPFKLQQRFNVKCCTSDRVEQILA
jgi:hypothetical protein